MNGLEIWLLAVGLAMDCFAISIASGILLKRTLWRPMLTMAFFLWIIPSYHATPRMDRCQHVQPPNRKSGSLDCVHHPCFPGRTHGQRVFQRRRLQKEYDPKSLKVVLALAVATSIDALAIGVSFAFLGDAGFLGNTGTHFYHRFRIFHYVPHRITVRYPFWLRHCTKVAGRTLGRYYPDYHRHKNINRTFVLQLNFAYGKESTEKFLMDCPACIGNNLDTCTS